MNKFDQLQAFLKNPKPVIYVLITEIIRENESAILDFNSDKQMFEGLDGDGNRITPDYAPSTVKYKKRKNQPYDRVTGRDSGEMHKEMYIALSFDSFGIYSNAEHTIFFDSDRPNAFGLSKESIATIRETIIKPNLQKKLKKYLDGIK